MDRYFRSPFSYISCGYFSRVSIHLLWTGTLEEGLRNYLTHLRCVSIHLLWTGTLEEGAPPMIGSGVVRFNPSFMDRYFRSFLPVGSHVSRSIVSIHLLWTGTLEDVSYSWRNVSYSCFNPSFMDRYFRRVAGVYRIEFKKKFQSIFYGQVL